MPLAGPPTPCRASRRLPHLLIGSDRQFVAAIILGVAAVAGNAGVLDLVLAHERIELLPEIGVLDWLERTLIPLFPAVAFPTCHPLAEPLADIFAVGEELHGTGPFEGREPLDRRLKREKQFGVEEAVRLAGEIAAALDYAHRRGVIHRDIKPANVLLQDGGALVADFGIALALKAAGGDRLTETGLSLGTPHYMSPEQASGDRDIDARTDIYALGAVLYEMLSGEPPHTGQTIQAILSRVLTESPRPLTDLRHSVPVPLVLHGSSGVPDETIVRGIRSGLVKVNVSTHLNGGFTGAVRAYLAEHPAIVDSRKYVAAGRAVVRDEAARLLTLFASAGTVHE